MGHRDVICIVFATEKTQKPFLKNAINYYLDEHTHEISNEKIVEGIGSSFYNTFYVNSNKESNKLLHLIYDEIGIDSDKADRNIPFYNCLWHQSQNTYYEETVYLNSVKKDELLSKREVLTCWINSDLKEMINSLTTTQRMKIAIYSHLIYCISYGQAQYEYISPLIERLKSRFKNY